MSSLVKHYFAVSKKIPSFGDSFIFLPRGTHPTLKVHVVSIDPNVPHQTLLGLQRNYLYRISSFDGHTIFSHLSLPTTIPPEKINAVSRVPHPLPTPQKKFRRHMNPVVSNYFP